MTRKEALQTESMLSQLTHTLIHYSGSDEKAPNAYLNARADAESLRRISMTLHRWHELECGIDGGCIERGILGPRPLGGVAKFESLDYGKPYWANHNGERTTYHKMPDREAGAFKRLAAIMARYPSLTSYVQGDPRGCALYILKPGDVPEGESPDAYYSRGLAVRQ